MSFERVAPEQHDTLDGIPEPAENPLLVAHGAEANRLAATYRGGKMHHALILSGPRGIGKATFAFHLAHHLLKYPDRATAPDRLAVPEPGSALHRMIASGAHPGVLYLARPMNEKTKAFRTAVTVEEIRRVNRFLSMTSHDGGYRIVIIDPADDMNTNAANALLKNLEEPPSRTLFILISHAAGGLLPTIRSRCQTVRLHGLLPEDLSRVLASFGTAVPDAAALAARAGGSVREAILLTEYGGLEIAGALETIVEAGRFDPAAAGKLADAVAGRDQAIPFALFNAHLLDRVGAKATAAALAGDLGRAEALSALWQETSRTIAETETYNLDKRQHVLGLVRRIQGVLARAA
ncbi:DNA polymerase III subunit delta' [Aquibium sp. ELW1220]|uniref:DNA polymerase III subunit delta' n=1 Tax=Aquibium sp. ELW1220 TaxID=2976766 RepID=UPI0025AFC159|nr:DNA polymerase III subunit delta' [Aquibium sp. ELW1220]MDN2581265.1 DNA polymerase III subunit delta' [Aquibium sp. ELW1220]